MAIGRITGSVLKSNLTRNGVDLAFETNLLYLDVTNSRVGIGTSEPSTALHVVGNTTITGTLDVSGALTAVSFSPDTISVNNLSSADSTAIQVNDALNVSGTLTANSFVTNEISSSESSAIQVNDGLNVRGSLTATGFTANGITYPTADGSSGQVLQTNGTGTLSFTTISTNSISQLNSNVTVTDSGTGAITVVADGLTIATFNTATGIDASTSTKSIRLPNGSTGDRPTGAAGMIRYNSTSDTIEGYTEAGGWAQLGAVTAAVEDTANVTVGAKTAISTITANIDTFLTSTYDSAWYLAVTRDEINEDVSTVKYSLLHNDTSAFVSSSSETKSGTNAQITVDADVSGGNVRLRGTGTSVVNSISFYRIGLGDNTTAGTAGNAATLINIDVDSTTESLDSWSMSSYRGAKYFISVNNTDKNEISNMECLVVHDGSNAYISTYNIVNSGNNDLLLLTADTDSSTVTLRASANTPNCRVTMYRILLGDSEASASGDNVNIVGTQTVSSSASSMDTFSTTDFTACHYVVVGHNATEGAASISEVTVVSDGADAYVSGGPLVSTKGTDQLTFTAGLSGTTVTLSAASTSGSSTTVNAYRVQLLRGIGGASTANTVLVDTTQTITGQKTFSSEVLLNSISSADSSAIQINDGVNVSGTLTANTIQTNELSSTESTAIQVNDGMNISGTLTANTFVTNNISSSESTAIQVNDGMNVSGPMHANGAVTFNAGYVEKINALTAGTTITVNCALAPVHKVTLTANTGFVITSLPTGGSVTVIVVQDGTGSRTATFGTDTSTAVKFAGGTPTLSTAASSIDIVTIFNDGTNYYGDIGKAYA
jgi:hypothetical protein